MSLRQAATAAAWGLLAYKLGTLLVNAVTFPRLSHTQPHATLPDVSVLIPARDEARNLPQTLPGYLAQGAGEVLLLDDHSTDETAALAQAAGVTVLQGQSLPSGWHGKPWACQQLAEAARGDLLVFTDADVTWEPGALAGALDYFRESGADLMTVWPQQDNRTLGERLLTPLVDDVLLTLLPWPVLNIPHRSASAANGQVMIFRRAAYDGLGGHAAVRAELLEDVMLARALKEAGGHVTLMLGGKHVRVRMYRSYAESAQGFSRNLLSFHGGQRALLPLTWALHFAAYTWPYLSGHRALIAVGLLEGLTVRILTRRTRPADLLEVLLTPMLPFTSLPVYAQAARRTVIWKGRSYQQGEN
ncbi:glycosyltransferase [Deinococcus radiophilus]|uniref:Glycosyltransferase n=1 Tax=Deinococcus radiophilus TaxID=32062 RepID=A0A3S0KC90_9DEIO|nr:glycosyltransferase family 2 protein [Deinococcus radiophilus]RTR27525.1 glycosyltransferase [Deinococcus radiophilus]UFA50398.1 glycosyltransferase [Deinococcus radiophilus]